MTENIEKFIFVHILKCAGTSLNYTLFEPYFKEKFLIDKTYKPKLNPLVGVTDIPVIIAPQPYPDNYESYDVISGHFRYKKYEHLNRPTFSFIRNPVDRLISHYHYFRGFYRRQGISLKIMDMAELWKNHMTYVLGDINRYEYIGTVEDFNGSLNKMCEIIGVPKPKEIILKRIQRNYKVNRKVRSKLEQINSDDMELYENIITKS
jgi:hypothetical protein